MSKQVNIKPDPSLIFKSFADIQNLINARYGIKQSYSEPSVVHLADTSGYDVGDKIFMPDNSETHQVWRIIKKTRNSISIEICGQIGKKEAAYL